ncbi:EamA-like transporter family protein [cyanobacterium TDX16]|nr:EamA-like transporter family protein [cyanobacterium TDX16]
MTLPEFGLFLISILASVAGQWLLKTGALKLGKVNATNMFSHLLGILSTPELLVGLACYGMGAFFYILVLTRVNLSVAGPAASLSYVFSVILGYFVFRESIPFNQIIALGFIVAGVILLVWRK